MIALPHSKDDKIFKFLSPQQRNSEESRRGSVEDKHLRNNRPMRGYLSQRLIDKEAKTL